LLAEVLLFSLVANISISSLNLSLLVNSVGTYQVSPENGNAAADAPGDNHPKLEQQLHVQIQIMGPGRAHLVG
jgi:hypothetical protein